MSRWVVVVPGIMGTSLLLNKEQIWPPSAWDVVTGFDDIDKLMDDRIEVGEIIDKVSIKSIYRTLLQDLEACGYLQEGASRRLIKFPYDWRRSNDVAAAGLIDRLDAEVRIAGIPDDITLIGHSMGGLVIRRVLESGDASQKPWFNQLRRLITFGTPHVGAPVALWRLTGHEKVLGVSRRDIVRLGADKRYPSMYELAGPPNTAFLVDVPLRGDVPTSVDRFDAQLVKALQLTKENVDSANTFWSKLDIDRRPAHVSYYFVGGSSHETLTSCSTDLRTLDGVVSQDGGDGTVPVSSAIFDGVPHGFSRKDHVRIFEDRAVRVALYAFLDAPLNVSPQAAGDAEDVGEPDRIGISTNKDMYETGEPIQIVVSYAQPIDRPFESFAVERIPEEEQDAPTLITTVDVNLDAAAVSTFSVTIGTVLPPGVYRLTPVRSSDDPAPTVFFVTKPRAELDG
jgi:phospholipase A1